MVFFRKKNKEIASSQPLPPLAQIRVGLGWKPRLTEGMPFDLDASAFLLGDKNQVASDQDFIFYNNLKSSCGSVEHSGDNQIGDSEDDDETIKINLATLPEHVLRIVMVVTIHDAKLRKQNFGNVFGAYIRIIDQDKHTEIARFDLSEQYSDETAVIFGEIFRHKKEWRFKLGGLGHVGGLEAMCKQFGVRVA